jgi:hypothetical protein
MFYSRPAIEPLGWDLFSLPVSDGCKHFDALTSDMRPVDFRFSGGWLTVERGPANAPPDSPDMEEVLSVPISPFGTMDIEPEQLCDILGLTVNGRKIDSAGIRTGARGFDLSGRTTYWQSTHLMEPDDDARLFIQALTDAFPGSILIQPQWGSHGHARCRQIKFLMESDELVTLGIDPDKALLRTMLAGVKVTWEEFESAFGYSIEFSRRDNSFQDVTGSRYIHQNGAAKHDLRYSVVHHRQYRICTQYRTEDPEAQARTRKLLSVIDTFFRRGLRMVDLQTGAVLMEDIPDDTDEKSYSIALRDRCLERPKNYLFVGIKDSAFYGARPTA